MAVDRRALADPRFLAATAVLIVNDHWAKAAFGNWLTGKLSDVAGLVVAGVLVAVAARTERRSRVGVAVVGGWFAAMKLVPAVAAATVTLADAVLPWSNAIVVDPTDLIALAALFLVRPMVERPIEMWNSRSVRVLGLVVAASAAVATSESEGDIARVDDLQVTDDGSIAWVEVEESARVEVTSACRPSDARSCFRIRAGIAVDESDDGGTTWSVVWQIDGAAAPTIRSDEVSARTPGGLRPRDIVVTDTEVAAAFSGLRPLVRYDGATWSPDPDAFRDLIWLPIIIQGVAGLLLATTLAAGVVRRIRKLGPGWDLMVIAGISAGLTMVVTFAAAHVRAAWLPLGVLGFVPLLMLLVTCGVALMEPTRLWRSLTVAGRVALAAVLLLVALVPPVPLQLWESSATPAYNAAVAGAILLALGLPLLAPLVVWRGIRRAEVTMVVPPAAYTAGK